MWCTKVSFFLNFKLAFLHIMSKENIRLHTAMGSLKHQILSDWAIEFLGVIWKWHVTGVHILICFFLLFRHLACPCHLVSHCHYLSSFLLFGTMSNPQQYNRQVSSPTPYSGAYVINRANRMTNQSCNNMTDRWYSNHMYWHHKLWPFFG